MIEGVNCGVTTKLVVLHDANVANSKSATQYTVPNMRLLVMIILKTTN
jgi:hypothetical protein